MSYGIVISFICAAIAGALAANLLQHYHAARMARRRLKQERKGVSTSMSLVESVLRPVFSFYAPLLSRFKFARNRAYLDKRFAHAALDDYTHEEFWAFQILTAVLFVIIPQIAVWELRLLDLHYQIQWWLVPCLIALGFLFPYIWLNSLISERRKRIVLEFPQFVANLTLTVEAGLDFIAAMNRIVRRMDPSPLQAELERMLSEIQLGNTRATALRNFASRVGATEILTFTLVLIQADRLGTSIGQALRVQAERLRRERYEAAERKGALASQKLLFPLIFFIMPAVFIVIFGPLIVRLVTEGLQGLMI